jgi:ABC-type nitrate/sulfonate/bicarbonate transport system permease component
MPSERSRLEPLVVWLAPLALVLLWQVVVRRVDPSGILPTPAGVARGLVQLVADGRLHRALLHSSLHILTGFGLAAAAAIPLGALTASSARAEAWLRPLVETFRPIAPYAWVPMAILWLGFGSPTVVVIVSYAAFFPIFVNTAEAVRRVPRGLVQAARTLGASRVTVVRRVMVPAALPLIFVGLRLGLGAAWIAVVAGELATATSGTDRAAWNGIGQMMFIFYAYSIDLNNIVVGMLGVGAMALVLDAGLRRLELAIMPWRRPTRSLRA